MCTYIPLYGESLDHRVRERLSNFPVAGNAVGYYIGTLYIPIYSSPP